MQRLWDSGIPLAGHSPEKEELVSVSPPAGARPSPMVPPGKAGGPFTSDEPGSARSQDCGRVVARPENGSLASNAHKVKLLGEVGSWPYHNNFL